MSSRRMLHEQQRDRREQRERSRDVLPDAIAMQDVRGVVDDVPASKRRSRRSCTTCPTQSRNREHKASPRTASIAIVKNLQERKVLLGNENERGQAAEQQEGDRAAVEIMCWS